MGAYFDEYRAASAASKRIGCPHCGMIHDTTCPRIKAMEYHQDGTIRRVEFHSPASYPVEPPKP